MINTSRRNLLVGAAAIALAAATPAFAQDAKVDLTDLLKRGTQTVHKERPVWQTG